MSLRKIIGSAAAALVLCTAAIAHHSQAMFDSSKAVTLTGNVTKVAWINPHVLIFVEVDENGKKVVYEMECNSALSMKRAGWTRDQYKVGDKVTVSFHPSRAGNPTGYLRKIVGPDGKAAEIGGGLGGPQAKPAASAS